MTKCSVVLRWGVECGVRPIWIVAFGPSCVMIDVVVQAVKRVDDEEMCQRGRCQDRYACCCCSTFEQC